MPDAATKTKYKKRLNSERSPAENVVIYKWLPLNTNLNIFLIQSSKSTRVIKHSISCINLLENINCN